MGGVTIVGFSSDNTANTNTHQLNQIIDRLHFIWYSSYIIHHFTNPSYKNITPKIKKNKIRASANCVSTSGQFTFACGELPGSRPKYFFNLDWRSRSETVLSGLYVSLLLLLLFEARRLMHKVHFRKLLYLYKWVCDLMRKLNQIKLEIMESNTNKLQIVD